MKSNTDKSGKLIGRLTRSVWFVQSFAEKLNEEKLAKALWGASGAFTFTLLVGFGIGWGVTSAQVEMVSSEHQANLSRVQRSLASLVNSEQAKVNDLTGELENIQEEGEKLSARVKSLRFKAMFMEYNFRYALDKAQEASDLENTKRMFSTYLYQTGKKLEKLQVTVETERMDAKKAGVDDLVDASEEVDVVRTYVFKDGSRYRIPNEISTELLRRQLG